MTVVEILRALVGFDTTSAKTNIPCTEWVRDYLALHGVQSTILRAQNGIHANLHALIGPSLGKNGAGGIGLSGHMDVVPTTGQPWDTNPYELIEKDGRLYGRGSTDMKGYLACVLAAVPMFIEGTLKKPMHVLFSYDEEVGCTGVVDMVNALGVSIPKPEIVFVGEPTNLGVVDAHKGGARFTTTVIGKDAHSSKPHTGVGAIRIAGELMHELGRMEERLKSKFYSERFEPPYSSVTVSRVEGGIAHNILPPLCTFDWGIRIMPGLDVMSCVAELQAFAERELLPAMQAVAPECRITTEVQGILPPFSSGEKSEAVSLAFKLAGQNETFAVAYGTEASHFQAAGCSSVVCGPGNIDQAHKPNEFIDIIELERCMGFMAKLDTWARA
ncbi:MAG: Acetylornithine deacetylase [Pseudomonadota bacterium]